MGKNLTINNLEGNTSYTITIYVQDKQGNIQTGNSITVKTEPNPPSTLTEVSKTNKSITFKWTASSGASYYDIERTLVNRDGSTQTSIIKDISSISYTDNNLLANQTYKYRVCAKSKTGEIERMWSSSILNIKTLPNKPNQVTGLDSALNGEKIKVTWLTQANVIGYKVRTDNNSQTDYYTTQCIYEFVPTEIDKQYSFVVTAFNLNDTSNPQNSSLWQNESDASSPVTIYSPAKKPGAITITDNKYDSVQFTWDKNNNPSTVRYKYSIEKGSQAVATSNLTYNNGGSFSNLDASTEYTIKIIAVNSQGIETEASSITFTTQIAPPAVVENVQFTSEATRIIILLRDIINELFK